MNKFLALILLYFFSSSSFGQEMNLELQVNFDSDRFELEKNEENKLDHLFSSIALDSIQQILISGHTDSNADSLYNIQLSQRRCDEIKNYLTHLGVNPDHIRSRHYGENKPLADNKTEIGKRINRRVDLEIQIKSSPSFIESEIDTLNIDCIVSDCIGRDTLIIMENGTELIFNTCEYIEIKDCLEIQSIRSLDEVIQNNTSLNSINNVQLITCGMIQLCVSDDCKLENDSFEFPVKVRFPISQENSACIPCSLNNVRFYNIGMSGNWVENKEEKIDIIQIGEKEYYELILNQPNCNNMINCDCPSCDKLSKSDQRKSCPKIKLKIPAQYELINARIFVDCPTTVVFFEPDLKKKFPRKNIGLSKSKCHSGDHLISIKALDSKGNSKEINLKPLEEIQHKILFSKCKMKTRDKQKILGIFPGKKRAMYRKYKVRKRDFRSN